MSNQDYIPAEDALYLAWLNNFTNQCENFNDQLNLTPPELSQIEALKTQFETAYNSNTIAKAAAKSAVAQKNSVRRSTEGSVRQWAKTFKGIPGITPNILSALGIIAPSTAGPVVTVTGLTVTGCSDGVNQLRWNRSTNAQGTIFIIEYQAGDSTTWELAGVVTSTRFDHRDQTPGQETAYRVISNRAGRSSAPCPPVVVYRGGNGEEISLAA